MRITAFDTHCHPQFPQYDPDRSEVIARAREAGVGMMCIGTDPLTSRQAVRLAGENDGIWASVGVHPNEPYDIKGSESLFDDPKVVAVGEIGLDFYRTEVDRASQETRFIRQLEHAIERDLPCIIHCRDAHDRMLEILQEHPRARGVIHSFNGSTQQALSYIYAGWYIGLNGIISFSDEYADMVRSIPLERILLETDAPYLSPVPYRGKRNEPARVLDVAGRIASIRGVSTDGLLSATRTNTLQCFSGISMDD